MSAHESVEPCVKCKGEMLVRVYGFTNPMGILCPKCYTEEKEGSS